MAYYITGDCHANFEKLIWLARFNKELGKEDVIILLGDVGLNYFGADKDRENKKILADFPNYFLCIHGNHEERPYHIQTYRIQIWLDYSKWYFGHYHDNIQYTDAQLLYEEIKELGEADSVQKVGRPRYRVGEMVYFTFGKEDAREGYGTVEWVDNYGTLGQEKEVSYDIVGIPCELPREKTLFKHIRESKIQSIDEMEIVKIEMEEG